MNLYVYETEEHAVIVDYGVMFAEPQQSGIDSILPDISYLREIKHKLRAVIATHGHEDHIGGLWDMAAQVELPVYTGRFTAELIRGKIVRRKGIEIEQVFPSKEYIFGDIKVRFFPVKHSIPDAFGLVLDCGGRKVVHLSDFTGDKNASFLPDAARGGDIFALTLDSTNALNPGGHEFTEGDVARELADIVSNAFGRVFVTTFASNVERIGSVISAAKQCGRKVVVEGAAMEKTVGIASRLGLISLPEDLVVGVKQAHKMHPAELVYIVSGCQGEYGSALYSICSGERSLVKIEGGDTLIFSSRMIPGNERCINSLVNQAIKAGAVVIQAGDRKVHVSGHAKQDELMAAIKAISPEYFIPIHGEYRHMAANRALAIKSGVDSHNAIIIESGDQLSFHAGGPVKTTVSVSHRYYDGRGGFVLDEAAYAARKNLARDGIVIIHAEAKKPVIDTSGFTLNPDDYSSLLRAIAADDKGDVDEPYAERLWRVTRKFFKKNMGRRPLVVVYQYEKGKLKKVNGKQ